MINVLVAWACARWGEHRPRDITIGATPVAAAPPEAQKFLDELLASPDPRAKSWREAGKDPPPPNPTTQPFSATGPAPAPSPLLSLSQQTGMLTDPNSGQPVEEASALEMEERRSLGCTHREYTRWRENRVLGDSRTYALIHFGFPFRSLGYVERYMYHATWSGGMSRMRIPGWKGGWPIAPSENRQSQWTYLPPRRVYPLAPLHIGFAANSAIYAVVLSTLLLAAQSLRRRLRHKHGLCRKCGYPIGVSPVCTECGADVAS